MIAYGSEVDVAYVREVVDEYLAQFPRELAVLDPLLEALSAPGAEEALNSRDSSGHLTAGAILVDPETGTILQLRHLKLERWLYPGGHVEPEDATLAAAARRELIEEAGPELGDSLLLDEAPVEIDVHVIPARPDGSEGAHLHFDFRFAFMAAGGEPELQLEEVSGHRWAPLSSRGEAGRRIEALLAEDPR